MKLRTQVLLGYAAVFFMMTLIAAVMFQSTNAMIATQGRVDHTHAVMTAAEHLRNQVVDMVTSVRGFAITGMEPFLEPYEAARTGSGSTWPSSTIWLQTTQLSKPGSSPSAR